MARCPCVTEPARRASARRRHPPARGHPRIDSGGGEVVQAGSLRSARVESLRALAALAVVVAHCWQYSYNFGWASLVPYWHRVIATAGNAGVELFFALSGYLIFRPFARAAFGGGRRIPLGTYVRNRFVRIMPLYWVAVVVLLVTTQHGGTGQQWWRFALMAQNFSTHTLQTVDGPMWSVVVEVQFYVLLPLVTVVLSTVGRGRRSAAAGLLVALGVLSASLQWIYGADPLVDRSLPATFYWFVPGMLLALLQIHWDERRPDWVRSLLGRRDLWLGAGLVVWAGQAWFLTGTAPLIVLASFLTVGAVTLPLADGPAVRLLDVRPLSLVGVVSYSLYMWHVPLVAELVRVPGLSGRFLPLLGVALPVTLAVATASYLVVERPALRLRRTWATTRGDGTPERLGPVVAEPVPELGFERL